LFSTKFTDQFEVFVFGTKVNWSLFNQCSVKHSASISCKLEFRSIVNSLRLFHKLWTLWSKIVNFCLNFHLTSPSHALLLKLILVLTIRNPDFCGEGRIHTVTSGMISYVNMDHVSDPLTVLSSPTWDRLGCVQALSMNTAFITVAHKQADRDCQKHETPTLLWHGYQLMLHFMLLPWRLHQI
jgi:hypothetical protein